MKQDLLNGNTSRLLFTLTLPMIWGMLSIMTFRLADAYFVSFLGTDELSALSFTFPVVMIVGSLALGLAAGASSVVSKKVGEGDLVNVKRLSTDILIISLPLVLLFALTGILTIEPVFRFLGAQDELLPLIHEYMTVWYYGIIFYILSMVGNGIIRATGDTRFPGTIMSAAAIMNIALDPLFIFGFASFPGMGIRGAAVASFIARFISFSATAYVLAIRKRLISPLFPSLSAMMESWKKLLYISVPSIGTHLMNSLSHVVIIKLLSGYGKGVVAGVGVAGRLESFGLIIPMAISSVIGPFTGQNWGAGKIKRIDRGIFVTFSFIVGWGVLLLGLFLVFGRDLALLFSHDREVVETIVLYFRIVSISYGLQGVFYVACSALNALKKPIHSITLHAIRIIGIYLPLVIIFAFFYKVVGVFMALMITNFVSGLIAYMMLKRVVNRLY
jgi:putative MATE family efflux protein